MRYRFLEFVLDTDQQTLAGPAGALPLRRQSFRVLQYLVEQAPAVVGKGEILDQVWGHHSISSSAVAQTIRELRELLGDHADEPRLIETRHRVGYRFIATVTVTDDDALDSRARESDSGPPFVQPIQRPAGGSRRRLSGWILAGVVVMAIGILVLSRLTNFSSSDSSPPQANDTAAEVVAAAMAAARNFDTTQALHDAQLARARHDNPRFALYLARLHILRGESREAAQLMAALEASRSQLQRGDQLMLDALHNELAGRYAAALDSWRILYELDPDDVDVGLALFDMQIHERDEGAIKTYERVNRLHEVPVERQLLMSAQRADLENQMDRQATQAQAAIAAAGSRWPALAALARIELGHALKSRGKISEAREMFGSSRISGKVSLDEGKMGESGGRRIS